MAAAIEVNNLYKEFNVPSGIEVAVDDVSLEIKQGEFISLVGPSGCGKTTTLRCIAGLETPTSGEILFNGRDVTQVPPHKRDLSMMFQNIALYPHMKIWENIAYPLKIRGVDKDERYDRAVEATKIIHLDDGLLDKYPNELSGGQRQRAALARTIVQDPHAFLMDEPLSDLDAKLQVEIRKEIQRIHHRLDQPFIYVTHNQEEAITMSDRIAVMNDGGIEQIGPRDEVYNYPQNKFVAQFVGNPTINFFEGEITALNEDTGVVDIYDREFRFDVDYVDTMYDVTDVDVGVRPHDIVIGKELNDAPFEGQLVLLEPIDDRALATIEVFDQEITVAIPSENHYDAGETVRIDFDSAGFHIFDAETDGLLIRAK